MPVDGYDHKHLWLYRSKLRYPWPARPILDPDWDELDRDWEWDLVDRLQRGAATPSNVATHDLFPRDAISGAAEGWEAAEEYSKNAVRTGAAYLNDQAIARRLPERELRKKAYAEQQARWEADAPQREAAKAQRAAEDAKRMRLFNEEQAERREAERVWRERQAQRTQARAEQDAEWASRAPPAAVEAKRQYEERAILANKWQCQACKSVAKIAPDRGGYILSCPHCLVRARGSHPTLVGMLPP